MFKFKFCKYFILRLPAQSHQDHDLGHPSVVMKLDVEGRLEHYIHKYYFQYFEIHLLHEFQISLLCSFSFVMEYSRRWQLHIGVVKCLSSYISVENMPKK